MDSRRAKTTHGSSSLQDLNVRCDWTKSARSKTRRTSTRRYGEVANEPASHANRAHCNLVVDDASCLRSFQAEPSSLYLLLVANDSTKANETPDTHLCSASLFELGVLLTSFSSAFLICKSFRRNTDADSHSQSFAGGCGPEHL